MNEAVRMELPTRSSLPSQRATVSLLFASGAARARMEMASLKIWRSSFDVCKERIVAVTLKRSHVSFSHAQSRRCICAREHILMRFQLRETQALRIFSRAGAFSFIYTIDDVATYSHTILFRHYLVYQVIPEVIAVCRAFCTNECHAYKVQTVLSYVVPRCGFSHSFFLLLLYDSHSRLFSHAELNVYDDLVHNEW